MAIADRKLQDFFTRQKIGKFDALSNLNNQQQTDNQKNEQLKTNTVEHLTNKGVAKGYQKGSNNTNLKQLSMLTGLQRKIIFTFYQNCRINGERITQELTKDHLADIIGTDKNTIKSAVNRLRKKGCISIAANKYGRGGWVKYAIDNELFADILHHNDLVVNDAKGSKGVSKG